jgi:signal transduction histidine kinase/CheY-like chemotaxis protein/HPt (histidine-containing phosphotransfer) domain-containing protein
MMLPGLLRRLVPQSLHLQSMLAVAVLALLISAGGLTAIYALRAITGATQSLAGERVVKIQQVQNLVRQALLIERESDQLASAESAEDVRASYQYIDDQLRQFDLKVNQLAAETGSDNIDVLDLYQSSQLFRNTANVFAQLWAVELQRLANQVDAPGSRTRDKGGRLGSMQRFHGELHRQASALVDSTEKLASYFSKDFFVELGALSQLSAQNQTWVTVSMAVSLLLAWLVAYSFLGKHVLLRLDRVSRRLRQTNADDWPSDTSPKKLDELDEMAQAVDQFLRDRELLVERTNDLAWNNRLFEVIGQMQERFIHASDPMVMFDGLLQDFLELSECEYGLIGDVLQDEEGADYLKIHAISTLTWDEERHRFHKENKAAGLVFKEMDNIVGSVVTGREPVIINNLGPKHGRTGLPAERPTISSFLGIPIFYGDRLVGEIGLANRFGGFDQELLDYLQPVADACGRMIVARWERDARLEAEHQLALARDAAEAATQAKSDFLASMSHEIRTPINAILGMLYLALKADMAPTLRGYLHKAEGAAKSLLGIINDILDFSKIEAGKLEVERTEFELWRVVQQLVDTIGLLAEQKNLELLLRYDVNIPSRLIGDPLRLNQILLNLSSNAIKFTQAGEVELAFKFEKLSDSELMLRISVRDTGIGLTTEQQQRLFQKFTQADQSNTRRFGGTGLGLAISRNLAELMDGRLWIEHSAPGQGTVMGCTIKLAIPPQSLAYKENLLEQVGPLLEKIRVLVTDDNEVSCQILSEMLLQFRLEVDTVLSGEAAIERLAQARTRPYDLVLMDWHMPRMNGDEVTRLIHADSRIHPQPKIVMVTAHGREEVIKLAERSGVNAFLTKPVSPSALLDTCLTLLGRGRLLQATLESHEEERSDTTPGFAGAHVLLVEDNEINREFAQELLRSFAIEVDTATNGKEAVDRVKRITYDAVLMDIQMPELDGLEATRYIRSLSQTEDDRFANLPIIAMTALAMSGDREKSIAAGMNDHITKPIDPNRLKAVLAQYLKAVGEPQMAAPVIATRQTNVDHDLLAMKHLDVARGIHYIGGKPEAYRRQLQRFRVHYADAADKLQQLIDEQGSEAGEAYCHALKGVCANLGADTLASRVTELDRSLKAGKRPTAEQFEQLGGELGEIMGEIDRLAAPTVPTTTTPLNPDEVQAKLRQLASLLKSDLGVAEKVLEELRSGVVDSDLEDPVAEIAAVVDIFAIDDALALITALSTHMEEEV